MKKKTRKPEVDVDSDVMKNTLEYTSRETMRSLGEFESYCNGMGVEVNMKELYSQYIQGNETAPVIAYAWWKANSEG